MTTIVFSFQSSELHITKMPDVWTKIKSVAFWAKRKWKLVIRDEERDAHIANYQAECDAKRERIDEEIEVFVKSTQIANLLIMHRQNFTKRKVKT